MVELGNFDNAYGNLDFIIANKYIRKKAYELIYDRLRKIVYQFQFEAYHFNLLEDGKGNFPVCILKVSKLNQEYFLQKEEKETNLTEFERLTCKKASKFEFVKVLSQSFLNVSRFSESESNAACPLWPR